MNRTGKSHQAYDKEFKDQAVEMLLASGRLEVGRPRGPDLLLLESACGEPAEEREEVVPILHRDDTTELRGRRLRWVSGRPGACAEVQRYLPTAQVGRQREA